MCDMIRGYLRHNIRLKSRGFKGILCSNSWQLLWRVWLACLNFVVLKYWVTKQHKRVYHSCLLRINLWYWRVKWIWQSTSQHQMLALLARKPVWSVDKYEASWRGSWRKYSGLSPTLHNSTKCSWHAFKASRFMSNTVESLSYERVS